MKCLRSPGSPIPTLFFLPLLAAAVLWNVPKLWTSWLGLGRRRGAAATRFCWSPGAEETVRPTVMENHPPTPPAQKPPRRWSLAETRRCCRPPWRPPRLSRPAETKTCWISWMRDSTETAPCRSAKQRAIPKSRPQRTATDLDSFPDSAPSEGVGLSMSTFRLKQVELASV